MSVKVKVNPGWQLGGDDGKLYYAGDTFEADDVAAAEWIASGQAVAVKAVAAPPANKAVAASANKTFTKAPTTTPKKKR